MTVYEGNLRKMPVVMGDPVEYRLHLGEAEVRMNDLIGQQIRLHYTGLINCINCGRVTKKSFAQGFCYPCFMNAPQNAECIIRPELCEAHLGKGRDPEWEERNHNQPHVVYLAISSGLKVGVTRETQVPTRWIDQGASYAVKLAETPNRRMAGEIEVDLKQYASDKTPWQKMLKNEIDKETDILYHKEKLQNLLRADLQEYATADNEVVNISYPAIEFPTKVKSINLDKTPTIEAELKAIKGQYLIFEDGMVINIRKYGGYYVELGV